MTQSSSPSSSPSSPETQTTEGKFRKELEILQRKYINQHNQSNQGVIVAKLVNRNNTELGIPLGHCNIGKSDNCTIQLITESVSDYHACFHSEGKNFFIMDTASTNGTGLSVSPGADFIELKNGFFYQVCIFNIDQGWK